MVFNKKINHFSGFSKLNKHDRLKKLVQRGFLNKKDMLFLQSQQNLDFSLAENFIENAIGYYHIPLGVAVNYVIDEKEYVVPMAIEETSVIAAACKTASWVRERGMIETENKGCLSIGQLQVSRVTNFQYFNERIIQHKRQLIDDINKTLAYTMAKRGGGVKDILIRFISRPDGEKMAVVHILVDTCDAMGANFINQICEYLKHPIEKLTGEKVNLSILSNLTDGKLACAKITIKNIEKKIGKAIEEASLFAQLDPYRAATNNKGVLNAIDAVLIATGNDWRAVEASIHAYAAFDGQYHSITTWKLEKNDLVGTLEVPINVGIVGGVTQLHPTASIALKMLNVNSAKELARVIVGVGLVQNLAALRALTTEGIVKGHMKLHINNLCLALHASNSTEKRSLKTRLEKHLKKYNRVSYSTAVEILKKIRHQRKEGHNT